MLLNKNGPCDRSMLMTAAPLVAGVVVTVNDVVVSVTVVVVSVVVLLVVDVGQLLALTTHQQK